MIAPFFADVDTYGLDGNADGTSLVTYGTSPDGTTFCVNWEDVGYFSGHVDKLNGVQLLITDRSASTGTPGAVRLTFNYDQVLWETGDASGGSNGFGGVPALAGYTDGSGTAGTWFQFPGSLQTKQLLDPDQTDSDPDRGLFALVKGTKDAGGQLGRYVFDVGGSGVLVGSLSGLVTDTGANPVANVTIEATSGALSYTTTTNAQGSYSLPGIPVGAYQITATPPQGSALLPGNGSGSVTASGSTMVATIVLQPDPNHPPTANAQSVTTQEDTATAITLTGADADNDPLTFTVASGPAHGTLTGTAPNLTYTPAANHNGPDSFTFTVNDGSTTSAPATVNISVTPAADPPTATAQSVTTAEDTATAITLTGADADNDPLTFTVASGPAHGTLTGTAPNLAYTPAADYNGPDSFTFTVNDGSTTSAPATVSITVTPVNDTPTATAQSVTTAEDTAKAITLAGTDVEGGALSFAVGTPPSHGALTGTAPNLTYTPAPDFNGPDSFTFTAGDGDATSAPATVDITVTPVADAPTATPAVREHTSGHGHGDHPGGGRCRRGRRDVRDRDRAQPRHTDRDRRHAHLYPDRGLQRTGLVHLHRQRRERGLRPRHSEHHRHRRTRGGKTPSTTTLTVVPVKKLTSRKKVTLTASVSPASASGVVRFSDSGHVLGSATLTGATATLTVKGLYGGSQSLVAEYLGNETVAGSVSAPVVVTVRDRSVRRSPGSLSGAPPSRQGLRSGSGTLAGCARPRSATGCRSRAGPGWDHGRRRRCSLAPPRHGAAQRCRTGPRCACRSAQSTTPATGAGGRRSAASWRLHPRARSDGSLTRTACRTVDRLIAPRAGI